MTVQLKPHAPQDQAARLPWLERHLKWLYWICAAGLAPWVAYLYLFQIPSGPAHQIHLMTVGLILVVIAGLLLTAWTYRQRLPRSVMAASYTATAVFMSVRFRLITGAGGPHWAGSIPALLALAVTVAALCAFVIMNRLSARPHVRWLPATLTVLAVALVPLLVVDLTVVPTVQTAHHLQLAWGGLDMFEVLALAATGFALHRRPALAAIPATATGALLICDAWINIIPSAGLALYEAIAMAFIELPLATVSFWIAARTSHELCAPAPAAMLDPESPGTTGLAPMLPFFSRVPLKAGIGAITAICGMLDAATFLGLGHVFAETMNGNIIFLAFTVGTHGVPGLTLPGEVLPYAVVLVCFAAGAVAGGRLVRRDGETGRRIGFASDAALIGIAAVAVALTHPGPAGQARYLVIGILAVAMGMQNVLIRRWGIPDLATNAMTKTMAYLVADSALGGGDNHHAMRRGMSIVIFAAGAAIGASLSRYGVLWPILTSFTVFVLALPILLQPPGK
jgi:uncharacterized membrane protein YoaK (UPF0700 family)